MPRPLERSGEPKSAWGRAERVDWSKTWTQRPPKWFSGLSSLFWRDLGGNYIDIISIGDYH